MKIAYITVFAPFSKEETFVMEEMLEMKRIGVDLLIIPRKPMKKVFNNEAQKLIDHSVWLPTFSIKFILPLLKAMIFFPKIWLVLFEIFRNSASLNILTRNLGILPKAVYITAILKKSEVKHIHAHWGTITSSMAWMASKLTNIPFSMTLHRYDIPKNNLLELKVKHAAFVRCIAEDGRREVLQIVGQKYFNKIKILYMGARMPQTFPVIRSESTTFTVVCPANYVLKKGHQFLLEACELLIKKEILNFHCLLIGDGPLKAEIQKQIEALGLNEFITLTGRLPHDKVMEIYKNGEVDLVALPSIVIEDGEREGIPVALMEAMAHKIPVISTNTGGITELLSDEAGIIIEEKNSCKIAEAMENLFNDKKLRKEIGENGYQKVNQDFNINKIVKNLFKLIEEHSE